MSFLKNLLGSLDSHDDYISMLSRSLHDGAISSQEAAELKRMIAKKGLTAAKISELNIKAIEHLVTTFMSDGYLDERELAAFDSAMKILGVPYHSLSPKVQTQVHRLHSLQGLLDGTLPVVQNAQIGVNLNPGEVIHYLCSCHIMDNKIVARGSVGGYGGVSFPIAKGIRLHTGGSRGRSYPIYGEVVTSQGYLCLTSDSIRYLANAKGFHKPWSKVSAVEPFSNALVVHLSGRQNSTILRYNDPHDAAFVEIICDRLLNS